MGNFPNFDFMSILNVPVSFLKNYADTKNPDNRGTFLHIATSEILANKYGELIRQIRAEDDPAKRKALKAKLPAFTPSGIFSEVKGGLIRHSGLVAFDLDAAQNPFLAPSTIEAAKLELSKLPQVAFCQISVSGTGLWGVVPIAHPDRHKDHFAALEEKFLKYGYIIDPACGNVNRLRYWSYDPAPYINHFAEVFTTLPKPKPVYSCVPKRTYSDGRPADLARQAADYLIRNRVPLSCTYSMFRDIMFACKNEWGEEGKDIALDILHACTTFAQSNTARKFDRLWRDTKQSSTGKPITAGTLVHFAKLADFTYHTRPPAPQPAQPANAATAEQVPTTQPEAVTGQIQAPTADAERQRFTDRHTAETFMQFITPEGYPAAWDDPTADAEPPAVLSAQDAADLMTGYGWDTVGTWQPLPDAAPDNSAAPDAWPDLPDLIQFFADHTPTAPVRMDAANLILDPATFIASHLMTAQRHNGKRGYLPYLERLRTLKRLMDAA